MNEDIARVVHSCHDCQKIQPAPPQAPLRASKLKLGEHFQRDPVKKADFDALQANLKAFLKTSSESVVGGRSEVLHCQPWSRLHFNFAGPMFNHMYLMVVDADTKWIEVFPMSN